MSNNRSSSEVNSVQFCILRLTIRVDADTLTCCSGVPFTSMALLDSDDNELESGEFYSED